MAVDDEDGFRSERDFMDALRVLKERSGLSYRVIATPGSRGAGCHDYGSGGGEQFAIPDDFGFVRGTELAYELFHEGVQAPPIEFVPDRGGNKGAHQFLPWSRRADVKNSRS